MYKRQIDTVNNVLGQIRRGTQGTSSPLQQPYGSQVVDGSTYQIIPGTVIGNVMANVNTLLNHGVGTAADGTGLNGSNTAGAVFIKSVTATNYGLQQIRTNIVTTEIAINIDTEDGSDIYTET